jgi:hypothetical protein
MQEFNKKLIGISGRIKHGKDTVGNLICSLYNEWAGFHMIYYNGSYEIKKYAYKLKQIASLLTGVPIENFESHEFKDTVMGEEWWYFKFGGIKTSYIGHEHWDKTNAFSKLFKPTYRQFIQQLGTESLRNNCHPDVHVNALFADYEKEYSKWLITDLRFINEAERIVKENGILLRVINENIPIPENEHISEKELDDYNFHYTIYNNGTLEELELEVKKFLLHFNIINYETY